MIRLFSFQEETLASGGRLALAQKPRRIYHSQVKTRTHSKMQKVFDLLGLQLKSKWKRNKSGTAQSARVVLPAQVAMLAGAFSV